MSPDQLRPSVTCPHCSSRHVAPAARCVGCDDSPVVRMECHACGGSWEQEVGDPPDVRGRARAWERREPIVSTCEEG